MTDVINMSNDTKVLKPSGSFTQQNSERQGPRQLTDSLFNLGRSANSDRHAGVFDLGGPANQEQSTRSFNFDRSAPERNSDNYNPMDSNNHSTSDIELKSNADRAVIEQPAKQKGRPIPNLDYGIDMVNDKPRSVNEQPKLDSNPSSPSSPPGPPGPQARSHLPNNNQHSPRYNFDANPQNPLNHRSRQSSSSMDDSSDGMQGLQGLHGMPGMPPMYGTDNRSVASSSNPDRGLLNPGFSIPEQSSYQEEQKPVLSYDDARRRKIEGIASFRRLKEAGYVPAGDKNLTFTTSLDEIEETVERLQSQRDLDNSIKFQRKILIGFATVTEQVCESTYNVFDLNLSGWSESVFENIGEYDDVFEELYYKYKGTVTMPPEIKLVGMVAGSAWMYHMSRDAFTKNSSKVPGFDEVMMQNPELKRQYQDAATNMAHQNGMPMPNKKGGDGLGFLGQMLNMTQMQPPQQPQPSQHQPQHQPQPQHQQQRQPHQHQHQQPQHSMQTLRQPSQLQKHLRERSAQHKQQQQRPQQQQHSGRPKTIPSTPPRRTRNRIPMNEPDDVDGLLGSLTGMADGIRNTEEDDMVDLSEMERLSELDD